MTEDKCGFKPFIFIETDFIRKNQPIFALTIMESTRRIQIPKEIYRLPLESQIPLVKRIIRKHVSDAGGEIPMWGAISCYKYFYTKHESIIFDVDTAVVTQADDISPPHAKVLLCGKELF